VPPLIVDNSFTCLVQILSRDTSLYDYDAKGSSPDHMKLLVCLTRVDASLREK
jgi:hypothetical protein